MAQAREAVEKAQRLIPDAPKFFLSRGWYHYFVDVDFGRAFEEFRKAAALSPSFADARYAMAMVHRRLGHWRETQQTLHEAERIDPANPEYAKEIAATALGGRHYAEADVALRRAMALGRTSSLIARYRILLPFLARGELPSDELWADLPANTKLELGVLRGEAVAVSEGGASFNELFVLAAKSDKGAVRARLEQPARDLRQRIASEPTSAEFWSRLGVMEALLGNHDEGLRCVRKAMELEPETKNAWLGPLSRINLALVHVWTGDTEGALRECERLLQMTFIRGLRGGWVINVHAMRRHPAFAPLRDDPRFQALLNDPKNNAPLF